MAQDTLKNEYAKLVRDLETNKGDDWVKEREIKCLDLFRKAAESVPAYRKFLKKNKVVTLTAVNLLSPFGVMEVNDNDEVTEFKEKPKLDYWMNGGYFVFNKKIFNYLKEGYDLEKEAFEELAKEKQIAAFKHHGFWKSMNTFKDVVELNELWEKGDAPWKVD